MPGAAALLLALVGCAYSWPAPTGHESLEELRVATDGEGRLDGSKTHNAPGDCWLDRDAAACAWVSAFWRADYESSAKLCETNPKKKIAHPFLNAYPCQVAAAYALGCGTVRGAPSGSSQEPAQFNHVNLHSGPSCSSPEPFPQGMIHAPEIDVDKALGFLVTGCRLGAEQDCVMMIHILLRGVASGIAIPQDIPLAHEFFLRYSKMKNPDEKPADVEGDWTDIWAKEALSETPEERDAKVRMVVDFYEKGDRFNAQLAGQMAARANSHSTLNAIAAGLSSGMATNAAVNSNLATAQTNINTTVAASQARGQGAQSARLNAQLNAAKSQEAQQRATQKQLAQTQADQSAAEAKAKAQEEAKRQAIADKRKSLAGCLDEDKNCEYGTSSACMPSVAYGDRFAERGEVQQQITSFNQCTGDWSRECWPKLKAVLPDMAALGNRVDAIGKNAPSEVANACPWKSDQNGEAVRQVPFWCGTLRKDCLPQLQRALTALREARRVDECVYFAQFQYGRNQLKAKHDDACHKQFD
jgi:hypothetical protein